jgi:hypothetical protein
VGGPNKGRGASFKQVFESEVQKEAREAKVESLSFEKLHAGCMPGWLSRTEMEQAERADPPPSRGGSVWGGGGLQGWVGHEPAAGEPDQVDELDGARHVGARRRPLLPKAGSGGGAQVRGF